MSHSNFSPLVSKHVPIALFSDCVGNDPDAEGRLSISLQSLFGTTPALFHVNDASTMAFLMTDALTRAYRPSLIIGNIAPRKGAHHYTNGIPFAYFWTNSGHLVVSTAQEEAFAGFKLLNEIPDTGIHVTDTKKALEAIAGAGLIAKGAIDHIVHSQFRSLDYEPLLAAALFFGVTVPSEKVIFLRDIPNVTASVAYIDRFGNCKLWVTEHNVATYKQGDIVTVTTPRAVLTLPFYRKLRDVKDGEIALIVGSSGPHGNHFCEIVMNGGNASLSTDIGVGDMMQITA